MTVRIALVVLASTLAACGRPAPPPPLATPPPPREPGPFEERRLATMAAGAVMGLGSDFSPDGRHVAYHASRNGRSVMVFDDMIGEEFDSLGEPLFSPDGTKLAYPAQRGGKWSVIIGKQKGPEFQFVNCLAWSPDSGRVAYWAQEGGSSFAVVDGQRAEPLGSVKRPLFSRDSRVCAYAGGRYGAEFVIAGNAKFGPYKSVWGRPALSADGSTVAFGATGSQGAFLMVNGKPCGEEYIAVYGVVVSADGSTIACWGAKVGQVDLVRAARKGDAIECTVAATFKVPKSSYAAQDMPRGTFLFDGNDRSEFRYSDLAASDDGERLAYALREGGRWSLVIDGRKGEPCDKVVSFTLSRDGRHCARVWRQGEQYYFGVDGEKRGPYDYVWPPGFSPDGRKAGAGARRGGELWWIVVPVSG